MMELQSLLCQTAKYLPGDHPSLDAQVLLAHALGQSRTWLLAHSESEPTPAQYKAFRSALKRLKNGEPLPYILGHWEFFGLDFDVTPDVLIPRPETELLIETALSWIRTQPQAVFRFMDIGTGSGCIPISLAVHVPQATITATDFSLAALRVACQNAKKHEVDDRITFLEADLFPVGLQPATFDLITANLPYIPSATLKKLPVFGREPTLALDGGIDGLGLIRRLLARLSVDKVTGCLILLEIESGQAKLAWQLSKKAFPQADISIKKDLAGRERLVVIVT